MILNVINIGDRIELKDKVVREDRKQNVYLSQLYDVDEDSGMLKMAMPIKEGRLVPLAVGTRYEAYFNTKTGFYNCTVRVTDRIKYNNLFILIVEMENDLQRYQRRQYYRIDVSVPFVINNVTETEYEAYIKEGREIIVDPDEEYKATTVDISGGGIRFLSKNEVEKGTKILMKINLDIAQKTKTFIIAGEILACERLANRKDTYQHRAQFAKVSKEQQEDIIKFIFEEERKRMKKERG
ncbi:MAG: flagellar brake protein [Lachnospiraceae bacterium]|nr:flagellar brake protein [Lachnospiraceae bacterium]